MSKDLFGFEPNDDDDDSAGDDEDEAEYVILQITPAEGWRAVFDDPGAKNAGTRTLGLACFALVEVLVSDQPPNGPPMRTIRPMVANEHGQIEDVAMFDEFVCLVPPGAEVKPIVDFAVRDRAK